MSRHEYISRNIYRQNNKYIVSYKNKAKSFDELSEAIEHRDKIVLVFKHSNEMKAKCIESIVSGNTVIGTAIMFGIGKSIVSKWVGEYLKYSGKNGVLITLQSRV